MTDPRQRMIEEFERVWNEDARECRLAGLRLNRELVRLPFLMLAYAVAANALVYLIIWCSR